MARSAAGSAILSASGAPLPSPYLSVRPDG